MTNRILSVLVALSILIATIGIARTYDSDTHICIHTQSIVRVMTPSTVTGTVHSHTPNNHNLQEMAVALEKNHDFANSADYMEGLTSISKRSIYVGEADPFASVRLII